MLNGKSAIANWHDGNGCLPNGIERTGVSTEARTEGMQNMRKHDHVPK